MRSGHHRRVYQVIELHVAAPAKPPVGAPCNGCGVCCASEPCPLGVLASRRLHGRCAALVWSDDGGLYRCGLIQEPRAHLPRVLTWLAPVLAGLARRYIAQGMGCDCPVDASAAPR